jgi:hypothetical protein
MQTNDSRRPHFASLLGIALTVMFVLPIRAEARNLDSGKMKDLVSRLVNERTGLATKAVDCPRRIPMLQGQKSTCTATLSDDTEIAIDFIQTNDTGDVTFQIRDAEALAVLSPYAARFVERWLAGEFSAIHQEAHQLLTSELSAKGLQSLLECNAADYGGLDQAESADLAVIHRRQGSGEVHVPLQFDGGLEVQLMLAYLRNGKDWKLAGLNMPPAPQDSTEFDQRALLTTIEQLFTAAEAGRWQQIYDELSHELQRSVTLDELRQALDDPYGLGAVGPSRILAVARNAHGLPVVVAMTQRERGPGRSLFSFRSCGEVWKVRTAHLIPPNAGHLTTTPEEIEAFFESEARKQGIDLTASCPAEEYHLLEGLTYTCTARHPSGRTAPIELAVTANDGSARWALLAEDDWR